MLSAVRAGQKRAATVRSPCERRRRSCWLVLRDAVPLAPSAASLATGPRCKQVELGFARNVPDSRRTRSRCGHRGARHAQVPWCHGARFPHCSSPNSIAPLRSVIPQLQVPTATSAQEQRVKLSLSWLPSSDEKPVPQLRSPQHAASGCHGSCAVPAARPVCGCRIGFAYS